MSWLAKLSNESVDPRARQYILGVQYNILTLGSSSGQMPAASELLAQHHHIFEPLPLQQ